MMRKAWKIPIRSSVHDPSAEAALLPTGQRGGMTGREYGATEIPFEAIGDIGPELLDLLRRAALGIKVHDRAPVDHRGREIGAVMDSDRRHRAVLGERDRRLGRDPGLGRCSVDHEDERLARALAQIDGRADCAPW